MNSMFPTLTLDSVAAIGFLNEDPALVRLVEGAEMQSVRLPIIVIGELYSGAERSTKVAENREKIAVLASRVRILFCDQTTAVNYGRIIAQLRRKGRPIPQNDAWIAALALQYDTTLLTRDGHFQHVEGLKLQSW